MNYRIIKEKLSKNCPIDVDGIIFDPLTHKINSHQKDCVESGLTSLEVGIKVVCYMDGRVAIRTINKIKQVNYLPRFLVGTPDDVKKWVGKTKILGVERKQL